MDEYLDKWYQFMEQLHERERYYELSMKELCELVRDFQVDCHDGFVSNDAGYIEKWLKDRGIDG